MNEQNTPPQPDNPEPEFVAWVAIDWANKKHYWSLQQAGSHKVERGTLDNTPEAVEMWMVELNQRFRSRPVAVALEQRRGALVSMLSKYPCLYLYPVHPLTLAKYRETWYSSRSKDDRKDADLLLEILNQHRDRLRRLEPDTTAMRKLQFEVENRRKLVDQRTAISNQLTDQLKIYFPQPLIWFSEVSSPLVGDLLLRWPTLAELQKAKPSTLEKFFREHNCRDEDRMQSWIQQIGKAIPATDDEAILTSSRFLVQAYVKLLAVLGESIEALEQQIEKLAKQQPEWEIVDSLPGAGKALAPRLMVALGSRRERYQTASELQCYSGIAAVKEASGNHVWVHMRWACPKFLRQTFHEWAACSIPFCGWAKAYYDQQRNKGNSHHTAVRALAFKWQRILFRCWQDRQPYRETVYLASLAKRALPIRQVCGNGVHAAKPACEKKTQKT